MSYPKIIFTNAYQKRLEEIEDFIWKSSGKNIQALETFLISHDETIEFLKKNPQTPPTNAQTGDQSWPFGDGRYRLFFKFTKTEIFLLDLIDNRMCNSHIYPDNILPTYDED